MHRLLFTTLMLFLLLTASAASAQEVRGTVSDVTEGGPIAGALLALVDGDSLVRATTISDDAGTFLLRAPAGDSLRLRIRRIGYAAIESVPIALGSGDSLRLEIRMRPQPVVLNVVTATGESRLRPHLERFLRRREMGFGRTFVREDIAALAPTSTAVLLSSLPGTFLIPGARGTLLAQTRGTYRLDDDSDRPGVCQPAVYLDGFIVEKSPTAEGSTSAGGFLARDIGVPISSHVSPDAILGIEVYRNPSQAPPEFQRPFMEDCPVVLIWTNYSFGIGEPTR